MTNRSKANILGASAAGAVEILVILIIAVLIFGKRLPQISHNLAKSMVEFKKIISQAKKAKKDVKSDDSKPHI
jgi:sec-independent protein translocase protein TatA